MVINGRLVFESEIKAMEAAENKALEIAKNLLSEGMNIDFIIRMTDLSLEKVQALQHAIAS